MKAEDKRAPKEKKNSRILIVDDEPKMVRLLSEILSGMGYELIAASSGEQAIEAATIQQPDLVLLDIVLLGSIDGYQVARRIRELSPVPIIMLTAKDRETDMLRGFEAGIDDYITKPFSAKELLARIRAVLNRWRGSKHIQAKTEIICGDVHINLLRHEVFIAGQQVHLTPTEYNLLHQFALHPNQVLLHEQLLNAVWGSEYRNEYEYLRSYVHMLRRKIEVDPANPRILIRVPGVGYMLEAED
jgi:DNA-binding response OmpR family regulator